jgi:hypothetical protein
MALFDAPKSENYPRKWGDQSYDYKLKGLKVAILATDGFEQVELVEPRKAFQDAGAKTRWRRYSHRLAEEG